MSITITSPTFVWGTTLTTILSSTRTDYSGTGAKTSTFPVQITTSIETWISVPTTITMNSTQSSSSSIFTSSASSLYTSTGTTTSDPVSSTNSTSTKGATSSSSTKLQPPPTGTNVPSSKGVSTGAAVGIGIGTAFAGAFLALLAIWIFFRRSRRSRRGGQNSWVSDTNHERGFGGVGKRVSSSIVALEDVPLDPADDSQIRKHMQDLYELIHQHAENHYSARNFEGRRQDLQLELAICGWSDGGGTEPSAQTIASLLANPATRRVAIRHVIARIILQHVDLESDPEVSLLPPQIVASGQAILKIKRTSAEQEAFSNSFTKWRHLTTSLLSPLSSRPDNLESDSNLRPAVMRNVKLLNGILQPFIKPGKEAQLAQYDNLASIILEGAHFGTLLFSQPSLWVFGWDGKNLNRNDRRTGAGNGGPNKILVVFPSIGKVVSRGGSEHLRVVVDAMLERV